MATTAAKAVLNGQVRQRVDAAVATLSKRFGIEVAGPVKVRDPGLVEIRRLEAQAGFLEAVAAATEGEWIAGTAETFVDEDGNPIPGVDLLLREIAQLNGLINQRDEQLRALGVDPAELDGMALSVEITDDGTPVVATETLEAEPDWKAWYRTLVAKAEQAGGDLPAGPLAGESERAYRERTAPPDGTA